MKRMKMTEKKMERIKMMAVEIRKKKGHLAKYKR